MVKAGWASGGHQTAVLAFCVARISCNDALQYSSKKGVCDQDNRTSQPKSSPAYVRAAGGIRWVFGTWAVAMDREGNKCAQTVPLLYSFCVALVVVYWVGFFFGVVGLTKVLFGKRIQSGAKATIEKVSRQCFARWLENCHES